MFQLEASLRCGTQRRLALRLQVGPLRRPLWQQSPSRSALPRWSSMEPARIHWNHLRLQFVTTIRLFSTQEQALRLTAVHILVIRGTSFTGTGPGWLLIRRWGGP